MDFITQNIVGDAPTIGTFLLSTMTTLGFGVLIALLYTLQNKRSKTMAIGLVIMPVMVQAIIMLVSGNIGAGVAVAGAFNLVRFRSAPGNAKDIGYIFFAMVVGFISGMGFLLFAGIFLVIVGAMLFGTAALVMDKAEIYNLRITLPENLDFNGIFDDLFAKYAKNVSLRRVRTTNMGSLYELGYHLELVDPAQTKAFIDQLRERNGNLNILLSQKRDDTDDL